MNKILSGKAGEDYACQYIKNKGFKIICRNYRCPYGELDIISKYKNTLVVIEVKYRKSIKFGKGYEAVNSVKQKKIIKSTEYYINENNIKMQVRFDIISIDGDDITHIENAFGI